MNTNSNLQISPAQSVAEILRQGVDLLREIDDELYNAGAKNAFTDGGAVGGHFRHCLEFVNCLLAGIGSGRIDYDKRERNHSVETIREYAIAEYTKTIELLGNFALPEKENALWVKPEDLICDADYWCESSIERELEFLRSHTIHHYALIAFKLRANGFAVSTEFGVAPSTLRFWKRKKSAVG